MSADAPPAAGRNVSFYILFGVFLALHGAKVARLIPIDSFRDGKPPVEYLHSAVFTDVARNRMTPVRLGAAPASTLPIVFDRTFGRRLAPEVSYKLFAFLALLSGPVFLFAAARAFQIGRAPAFLSAVIFSAGFMSHDEISRQLIYHGHLSFWLGSLVAIFNAGCLYGWAVTARRRLAVAFVLTAMVLPAADPLLIASQLIVWAAVAVLSVGASRRRALVFVLAGSIASAAVNFGWLAPFIETWNMALPVSAWMPEGRRGIARLWAPAVVDWQTLLNTLTRAYLAVFGVAGLNRLFRENARLSGVLWSWIFGIGALAFFAASFGLSPLGDWGRFPFLLTTFLLIPAGVFVENVFLQAGTARLLVFVWYLWFSLSWQIVNRYDPRPLREELTPAEQRLSQDLQRIPAGGRVLVQYDPLFTDALRLASLDNRRGLIGFTGTPREKFEQVGRAWFLNGRPFRAYTEADLTDLFRRSDVRYVLAVTSDVHLAFGKMKGFEEIPSRGEGAYWIHHWKNGDAR